MPGARRCACRRPSRRGAGRWLRPGSAWTERRLRRSGAGPEPSRHDLRVVYVRVPVQARSRYLCAEGRMTDRPTIQAAAAANATSAGGSQSPAAYRQDDDRRRDEARIAALQSQVDELRQLTRELASRQVRSDDIFKHQEGVGAQNRLAIDQLRKEMQQSAQARA